MGWKQLYQLFKHQIIIIKIELFRHRNRPVQTRNEKAINRPNAYRNVVYDKGGIACQCRNKELSINDVWDNRTAIQKMGLVPYIIPYIKINFTWKEKCVLLFSSRWEA